MDGTLIILVLLVLMYVVLFLPRQRQMARQRAMQAAIAPGDEVVTIGGIHGTVTELVDDAVRVEVSPGVELRFVRDAIARRLAAEAPVQTPAESPAEPLDSPAEPIESLADPVDDDGSSRS